MSSASTLPPALPAPSTGPAGPTAPAAPAAQAPTTASPAAEAPAAVTPLRLSFSRVDTYRTCPLKYRYAYVDELPTAPSPHLSWGSSLHAALERWWDQKLPEAPPVEALLQALYDCWDDEGFEGMAREEKVRWYRHGQEVLRRHHERHARDFVAPMATEQWFELDLGDQIQVVGSIDHVAPTEAGGFGIVDWKTNRKAKTRRDVAGSLQLAIYTLAAVELWGREPDWVALDFVVPGVRVTVDRADIDTAGALATIREVAALVRAEAFEPRPSALCGWCDFRADCPVYEADGPDVTGAAVVELRRLRRRQERDTARIAVLEELVRDRLGDEASVTLG